MNLLSIDLDYFINVELFKNVFCKSVFERDDILVVRDHHELLDYFNDVNDLKNNLYNIDYHADIIYFGSTEKTENKNILKYFNEFENKFLPNVSSWVNRIEWRKKGNYYWCFPKLNEKYGYCWYDEKDNPYSHKSVWNSINKTDDLSIIPWNDIDKVGICISPEWIDFDSIDFDFFKIFRPYLFKKINDIRCTL